MRAFALVALVLVPAAAAASPSSRVITPDAVGAYRITQAREQAIDVFGAPTTSHSYHPYNLPQRHSLVCRTYWRPLELVIEYSGECLFAGPVRRITVEGNGWRTREGLRVGDSVKRLTRVYRGARIVRVNTAAKWGFSPLGNEWDLRRARPSSSVIVATQSGRVVGFELRRL